jgi:sarcosine oxidase subunit beta
MKKADVVVIGGGINGCAIVYNLVKSGLKAMLFEKKYLASGATGRCGGGIRQQWSTEENIRLAMGSVKIFEGLEKELGYAIEYKQGGYLILAHDENEIKQFKKNVRLQKKLGLNVDFLQANEINDIVPILDVENIGAIGATWCQTDGHADPAKTTFAYAREAERLGASINTYTEVTGIKIKGKSKYIITTKGKVETEVLVNAAGSHSTEIAKMVGVELPIKPYRHEILATEPLEPVFTPMIISFHDNVYFRQTERGEIVGGWGDPNEPSSYNIESSLHFLKHFCHMLTKYVPAFKHLNVVRQWAGLYDVTPDARPILGQVDEIENFIQVNGFSGHGFMVAPMTAKLITELIVSGKTSLPIDSLNLRRFREKSIEKEVSVVG